MLLRNIYNVCFRNLLCLVGRGGGLGSVPPVINKRHIEMHGSQSMPRMNGLRRDFALVVEQVDSNPVLFLHAGGNVGVLLYSPDCRSRNREDLIAFFGRRGGCGESD